MASRNSRHRGDERVSPVKLPHTPAKPQPKRPAQPRSPPCAMRLWVRLHYQIKAVTEIAELS